MHTCWTQAPRVLKFPVVVRGPRAYLCLKFEPDRRCFRKLKGATSEFFFAAIRAPVEPGCWEGVSRITGDPLTRENDSVPIEGPGSEGQEGV